MLESLKSNKGYSLIEIAATIAIIAIIAAFAIPTMNRYIVQGKVSDALMAVGPVQTKVVNQIAERETVTDSGIGITLPTNLGSYVAGVVVGDDGAITITMDPSAASVQFILTPVYNSSAQQVSWTCQVTDAIYNDYVPTNCRI